MIIDHIEDAMKSLEKAYKEYYERVSDGGPSPGEKSGNSGGGSKEPESTYIVLNLDELLFVLDGAVPRKDEVTALCQCGGSITQYDNRCPDCNTPVVWRNSTPWKRRYGKPDDAIRKLQGVNLKPGTYVQREVARLFGNRGQFQNMAQKKETQAIEKKYDEDFVLRMLYWASDKSWTAFTGACVDKNLPRAERVEEQEGYVAGDELM